jgi:uncharacterized Zn finger protein (UPF0148 family)
MAIRITCPGCKTSLTLDDDKRGQKIRCDNCDKALNIPAASGAKREKEMAVQNGQSVKAKPARMPPPEFDEEEAPKKSKKKKKQQSGPDLILWLVAGGAVLFLVGVGWGGWAIYKAQKPAPDRVEGPMLVAKPEEKPEMRSGTRIVVPSREEGNPANMKKGGKGVISNVRGSAWRTERRAELKSIQLSYIQFCDDYKGTGRNMMNFMEFIKQSPSSIRDPIKEGYYVMNFKADPRVGESIIAYERDLDNNGHLCCKTNGDVDYVSVEELKAALGN